MDVRRAYCSAVDRTVPVVLRTGAAPRERISLADPADLVCLDYKVRCTGWMCPLFSVSDDPRDDRDRDSDPGPDPAPEPTAPAGLLAPSPRLAKRWTRRT